MSTTVTPLSEKALPDLAAALDASLAARDEDPSWMKRQEALVTIGRQARIDVTKQREAEERAARAEKLVDQQAEQEEATESTADGKRHPASGSEERRQRPRLTYPYRQLIAPIVNGRLPSRQDFVELECHDIAVGGFSYYAPAPPSTDQVVIALGIPPRLTFLIARIVHVRRVTRDSKSFYLTGCMYTGRAEY